jgi:hypothetical protein
LKADLVTNLSLRKAPQISLLLFPKETTKIIPVNTSKRQTFVGRASSFNIGTAQAN